MDLATLPMLKAQVNMENSTHDDAKLAQFLEAGHAIVLDYIARPADADWTATVAAWDLNTVPKYVQAAILMQAAELYRFRGDDEKGPNREIGDLSPNIKAVLRRTRMPVFS